MQINVNDKPTQIALKNLTQRILGNPTPLLNIAGNVMRSSVEQTFRDQGSPAGSWPPLAALTARHRTSGHKILIGKGRLKNSITFRVSGNQLAIGTNLKYAAIHQFGGEAGRRPPFKKPRGRRARIPARPYLVFRTEDPQKIADAMQRYIDAQIAVEGLN